MKKIILSMLLLAGATTYAQVGINEESPKATLDISVKDENKDNNHLEGLLIPRVSINKALQMGNNSEIKESTMIYVNDLKDYTTSPADAKVADITENGFYFWNGTKWVKQTGQDGEEWVYNPDNQRIELKRSGQGDFKGKVFYNKIGGYNNLDFMLRKTSSGDREVSTDNLIPNDFSFLNTVIKNISSITPVAPDFLGGNKYSTGINYNLLKVDNLSNDGNIYVGSNVLSVDNTATISANVGNLYGTIGAVLYNNSRKVWGLLGLYGGASLKGSSRAVNVFGAEFKAYTDENTTSERAFGMNIWVDHKGTSNYAGGVTSDLRISGTVNKSIANGSFGLNLLGNANKVISTNNRITIGENATTTEAISVENGFRIKSGATVETLYGYRMNTSDIATGTNITDFYGIYLDDINKASGKNYAIYTKKGYNRFGDRVGINTVEAPKAVLEVKDDLWTEKEREAAKKNIVLLNMTRSGSSYGDTKSSISTSWITENSVLHSIDFGLYSPQTKTDPFMAFSIAPASGYPSDDDATVERMRITSTGNVGIGTTTPNEKLEVNGKIKSSSLVSSETTVVVANADGVLSLGNSTDFSPLWANDGGVTKLKNGVDGTTTRTDDNRVTIDNDGAITAKAFVGYNGASIFPDYVFEKYYKGYSDIKADYNFHNLASVESFIKKNGHLPGYKSAKEIAKEGLIDISATQLTNVEKIEELYLHTIEQEKKIETQQKQIATQQEQINELKALVNKLINK